MSRFADKLHEYVNKFKHEEGFFTHDLDNIKFFSKYPNNADIASVRLKLSALNHNDIEKLSALEPMTKYIVSLSIDERLRDNDLSLVEDIANIDLHRKHCSLLNFASTYCNYHKPGIYPIFSEQHLEFYKGYSIEHHLDSNANVFGYLDFKTAIDDMLARYHVKDQLNYYELRKLGWLYLDKIIAESNR